MLWNEEFGSHKIRGVKIAILPSRSLAPRKVVGLSFYLRIAILLRPVFAFLIAIASDSVPTRYVANSLHCHLSIMPSNINKRFWLLCVIRLGKRFKKNEMSIDEFMFIYGNPITLHTFDVDEWLYALSENLMLTWISSDSIYRTSLAKLESCHHGGRLTL